MKLVNKKSLMIGALCMSVLMGQMVWASEVTPAVVSTEKVQAEEKDMGEPLSGEILPGKISTGETSSAEIDTKELLVENETEEAVPVEENAGDQISEKEISEEVMSVEEENIEEVEPEEACVEEVVNEDVLEADKMKLDIQINYQGENGKITNLYVYNAHEAGNAAPVLQYTGTGEIPNLAINPGDYRMQIIAKDSRYTYCLYAETSDGKVKFDTSNMSCIHLRNMDTTYGTEILPLGISPRNNHISNFHFISGSKNKQMDIYTNVCDQVAVSVYIGKNGENIGMAPKIMVNTFSDVEVNLGTEFKIITPADGNIGTYNKGESIRLAYKKLIIIEDTYGNYVYLMERRGNAPIGTATIIGTNNDYYSRQAFEWGPGTGIDAPPLDGKYKLHIDFADDFLVPFEDVDVTFTVGDGKAQPETNTKLIGFVEKLYEDGMGRAADEEGLNSWVSQLKSKSMDACSVVKFFVNSPEFRARHSFHEDYIKALYLICLNRAADDTGLNYWVDLLKQGETRYNILARFTNTDEFAKVCESYQVDKGSLAEEASHRPAIEAFVSRFYEKCMGRPADQEGLNYWVNGLLSSEYTGVQMAINFVISEEFSNKGQSDEAFINTMYEVFFDRAADQGGTDYWNSQLEGGQSRFRVTNGFIYSAEFKAICDSYGIRYE